MKLHVPEPRGKALVVRRWGGVWCRVQSCWRACRLLVPRCENRVWVGYHGGRGGKLGVESMGADGSSSTSPGMMLGGGCGQELAHWIVHGRPEKDMYSYDIRRVW